MQIVFQDPYSSLNPIHSIGRTLAEAVRIPDPAAKDVRSQVGDLLVWVGLPAGYARRRQAARKALDPAGVRNPGGQTSSPLQSPACDSPACDDQSTQRCRRRGPRWHGEW